MAKTRVCFAEPRWDFDNAGPRATFGASANSSITVDPFPCYAHNEKIVRRQLAACHRVWPLTIGVEVVLLAHEDIARTNGFCATRRINDYYDDDKNRLEAEHGAFIVLSGKRIPLHPAMTRYLVAHEYGHAVESDLSVRRGIEPGTRNEVILAWCAMRGVDYSASASGGRHRAAGAHWHESPHEMFANDFRVAIMGCETEFWPHPIAKPVAKVAVKVRRWFEQELEVTT